jgi:hypothetical protein
MRLTKRRNYLPKNSSKIFFPTDPEKSFPANFSLGSESDGYILANTAHGALTFLIPANSPNIFPTQCFGTLQTASADVNQVTESE